MEYKEHDEAELARRKKDQIEWRKIKKNTDLFTIVMTLIEILVTLAVILVLFLLTAKITFSVGDPNLESTQRVFLILMLVVFFGGLFIGFILFKLIARWAIKHFELETKLTDEVLDHYTKKAKDDQEAKKR